MNFMKPNVDLTRRVGVRPFCRVQHLILFALIVVLFMELAASYNSQQVLNQAVLFHLTMDLLYLSIQLSDIFISNLRE